MLGLDVSDRSIKIVELSDREPLTLKTACWSPMTPNIMRRGIVQDAAQMTATIGEALTKCSLQPFAGKQAVVSIPEMQSFARVLELPLMAEEELDEAVQWAIRQHIPFDLDRVYLDWQPLVSVNRKKDRQEVLVGASQRDVVDPLLQIIDNLKIQVVALELEAQAIVRALLPHDSQDVAGVLLIDLGATSTNVIYFNRGAMRFTTSIQRGGDDLTRHLAQQLKLQPSIAAEKKAMVGVGGDASDTDVATTLREVTLGLVQQIKQSVHEISAQTQMSEGVRAILLAGGAANLPGLASIFGEVFPGVPVQMGNPLINIAVDDNTGAPRLSPQDATHFTTALGLASRRVDYARQ